MLEKVFCSNIAPSLSFRNHLFYKAEYMGQSVTEYMGQSVTELPELGFVHNFRLHWGALATWIKLLWTAFWKLFSGIPHLLGFGYVPAPGTWISRYQVLCARWQERWASGVSLKRALKMQFRNAYFRLLKVSSLREVTGILTLQDLALFQHPILVSMLFILTILLHLMSISVPPAYRGQIM